MQSSSNLVIVLCLYYLRTVVILVSAGLTANVEQRHKKEREQLTHHFHRSLKCLQQKEHVDGATIVRLLLRLGEIAIDIFQNGVTSVL